MRIIVAGSRTFNDYNMMKKILDAVLIKYPNFIVVSGAAKGADLLGEKYAKENKLEIHRYVADWNKYNKAAGFKRNVEMSENADGLIAFWDSKSKGTKHMIDEAKKRNLKIKVVLF